MESKSLVPLSEDHCAYSCDCLEKCYSLFDTTYVRKLLTLYRSNFVALLTSSEYILLLNSGTIVVGRKNSIHGDGFPASDSTYVSGRHFTITYTCDGKFILHCLSKNGIIIDNIFCRKREDPYILPEHCIFRFPSTAYVIHFKILKIDTVSLPVSMADDFKDICETNACEYPLNRNLLLCMNETHNPLSQQKQHNPKYTSSYSNHKYDIGNITKMAPSITATETVARSAHEQRPPYSYSQLIVQAISSSPEKKLPLCKIYSYIIENYPYYQKSATKSWQNSIRHNLSLNKYFLKTPQPNARNGNFWMIDPPYEALLVSKRFVIRNTGSQLKYN